MGKLQSCWEDSHQIYYHAKAPELPKKSSQAGRAVFKPKTCLQMGICICRGDGRAGHLFWRKLSRVLRKKFPKKTPPRHKLDSGLVVLRLDSPVGRIFLHIGYINLKTLHFTTFRLRPDGPPVWDNGCHVQKLVMAGGRDAFGLAIHTFANLDLDVGWTCRFCYLLMRPRSFFDIHEMKPHHVEVLAEDSDPDFVWKGWEAERPKRESVDVKPISAEMRHQQHVFRGRPGAASGSGDKPCVLEIEAPQPLDSTNADVLSQAGSFSYAPTTPASDGAASDASGQSFGDDLDNAEPGSDSDDCNEYRKAAEKWLDLAEAEALFGVDDDVPDILHGDGDPKTDCKDADPSLDKPASNAGVEIDSAVSVGPGSVEPEAEKTKAPAKPRATLILIAAAAAAASSVSVIWM